jgi:hypothetical protein
MLVTTTTDAAGQESHQLQPILAAPANIGGGCVHEEEL